MVYSRVYRNAAIGLYPIAVAKKRGLNLGYSRVFEKRGYSTLAAVFTNAAIENAAIPYSRVFGCYSRVF